MEVSPHAPAVLHGQPAWVAGLQEGDVIEHVDGQRTADKQQFHSVVSTLRAGETYAFHARRHTLLRTIRCVSSR